MARLFLVAELAVVRADLKLRGPGVRVTLEGSLARLEQEFGADSRLRQAQIDEVRAELAESAGDAAVRDEYLNRARRAYTEVGARGHAERLAKEMDAA